MISSVRKLVIDNKNFIYMMCIFIIMLSLSAFTLEDNNNKQEIMSTLMWVCTAFVLQISTGNLFSSDYQDGILEQIFIQPFSPKIITIYKILSHWLLFGLPISIISFIFSIVVLENSISYSIAVSLSLLINTLIIINISAVGNALMVGRSNVVSGISQILVLPLIMPTFIYFKLLTQLENAFLSFDKMMITALVFAVLIINSVIATHIALKFAVEQD